MRIIHGYNDYIPWVYGGYNNPVYNVPKAWVCMWQNTVVPNVGLDFKDTILYK